MQTRRLVLMPALFAATLAVAAESPYDICVRTRPGTQKSAVILEVAVSTPSSRGKTRLELRAGAATRTFRTTTNGETGPNGSFARTRITASLDPNAETVTYEVETTVDRRVVASRNGSVDVRAITHAPSQR